MGDIEVSEREISIHELVEAAKKGNVVEAFGAGTACVVCPIEGFQHDGKDYSIPINEKNQAGDLTFKLSNLLGDIYSGRTTVDDWLFKV